MVDKLSPPGASVDEKQFSPEQAIARRHAERRAEELLETKSDILLRLGRDVNLTLSDIARQLFPADEFEEFPGSCAQAAGIAFKKLVSPDEWKSIRTQRIRVNNQRIDAANPERVIIRAKAGGAARKEQGLIGEARERFLEAGRLVRERRSQNPKRLRAIELAQDPAYFHKTGNNAGSPDYDKIAQQLDAEFHGGEAVTDPRAVGRAVRDYRYTNKKRSG